MSLSKIFQSYRDGDRLDATAVSVLTFRALPCWKSRPRYFIETHHSDTGPTSSDSKLYFLNAERQASSIPLVTSLV